MNDDVTPEVREGKASTHTVTSGSDPGGDDRCRSLNTDTPQASTRHFRFSVVPFFFASARFTRQRWLLLTMYPTQLGAPQWQG